MQGVAAGEKRECLSVNFDASKASSIFREDKSVDQRRLRGIIAAALRMITFGLAEVTTGLTHNFFGISTARGTPPYNPRNLPSNVLAEKIAAIMRSWN